MEAAKAECNCLDGRVRKSTLPVFHAAPGSGAPPLKRLLLPQGELAQVHHGEPAMRYIAFVELREGTVRGNHFHKCKDEWIYLLSGEVRLVVEDPQSKKREFMEVQTGELVVIAPGVAHALKVAAPGQAVEFSATTFDPADTYRYTLV